MSNPWFRMYHEFADDPKVQRLSEVDQRRFIMLLCLRCRNSDVTLHDEDVTFTLRISDEEWQKTKSVLHDKNLIDSDNMPTAWDKRQYKSDSSAERVAKHREKKKQDVTLQKQESNVPEQNRTDTDTDTDTDTEQIQSREEKKKHTSGYSDDFNTFWTSYPKKTGKGDAWVTWKKLKPDINQILMALSWQTRSQQWQSGYIPNPKTYLNGRRWEDSPTREIQPKQTKHDVYMDTINQIFPERRNGTNRPPIDITPSVTIESDRTSLPEAVLRLRKSDGD